RAAAALVIVVDLLTHGYDLQPHVPRAVASRLPPLLPPGGGRLYRPRQLQPVPAGPELTDRVIAPLDTPVANVAARHGWSYFPGYDQGLSPRLHAIWDAAGARGAELLARFGVGYVILDARDPAFGPPLAARNGLVLKAVPGARSRAYVADGPDAE